MDTQHPSAPACAEFPVARSVAGNVAGNGHPTSGVVHENVRIPTRFTVVSNDLAQHRELSATAIGISVHIQSLPAGTPVDIRSLTARFQEGRDRISTALNQLEAHGYLRRERHRLPNGRMATRTVSCNRPGAAKAPDRVPGTPAAPEPGPAPAQQSSAAPRPPREKRRPRPLHVPHPSHPSPTLLQQATDLLATLHRREPALLLSAEDTARLAPGVAAWLEREATPTAVRHALTGNLPEPVRHPAALLAHRLTALLPPPPPFRPPALPDPTRYPLHNCDTCDHAYRGPEPGACPSCAAAGSVGADL
ncbi:helix-turn-helix domain-containing protein [Streptomyces sp. VRA16 Mangrove soil]|uniref:helix-turn-helix domain-containing protein n=1 Tax=Streptomyces sp. VRA16 Mangrove soil TaxID=2817434 RepID=UPI001A9FD12D|nr:helix-turn-helix domain-containing protein [Streptomyces sp. VRA16 Mangrove soil]MBO1335005.1 helix-turn-helix domain-containing protein [Streptomyces sp. VRA16 Mangrove soil]